MNSRLVIGGSVTAKLSRRWFGFSLICASCLLSACGTSGSTKPTGSVTVTLTSGGQPVTEGSVQLVAEATDTAQGQGAFGDLKATGIVEFSRVEVGRYVVTVMPAAPLDPDPSKPAPPRKGPSNIPPKLNSQMTSTLKAEVKPGDNKFAFDLKQL